MKRLAVTVIAAALMFSMLIPGYSQARPGAGNRPQPGRGPMGQARQAPANFLPELKKVADSVAEAFGARVVVDPALFVMAKPKPPTDAQTVEAALDYLVSQVRRSAWKKVYLKEGQGEPLPEKLGESLRAVDAVEQAGLVVETPAARRASTLLKDVQVPADFSQELAARQFSTQGIYVLYSTVPGAVAGKSLADRLIDMQRESMELMQGMDEQQLAETMSRGMELLMNMDPAMRGRFMAMQARAAMQMFQNMPPDQRNALMQEMMQIGMSMFGGGQGGPPPPGNRRP